MVARDRARTHCYHRLRPVPADSALAGVALRFARAAKASLAGTGPRRHPPTSLTSPAPSARQLSSVTGLLGTHGHTAPRFRSGGSTPPAPKARAARLTPLGRTYTVCISATPRGPRGVRSRYLGQPGGCLGTCSRSYPDTRQLRRWSYTDQISIVRRRGGEIGGTSWVPALGRACAQSVPFTSSHGAHGALLGGRA